MPQIFNPSDNIDDQQVTDLQGLTVTATPPRQRNIPRNEFVPTRTLKNSVASQSFNGNPNSDFEAIAADIPDNFATNEQPKLKFLFTVEFGVRAGLNLIETGSESMDDMKFALKRAGRPNPQIVYQDVNYYGLRQKVGIRTDYGTVSLTFYDDVVNRAHSIVSQYINYVSPIANIARENADTLAGSEGGAITYGALGHPNGPFQWMRVTHHMINDQDAASGEAKQVYYDYLNPKIINVILDELDMTQSDVSNVEVTFVYDSVNITYSDVDMSNPTTTDNSGQPITNSLSSNVTALQSQSDADMQNQLRSGFQDFNDPYNSISTDGFV